MEFKSIQDGRLRGTDLHIWEPLPRFTMKWHQEIQITVLFKLTSLITDERLDLQDFNSMWVPSYPLPNEHWINARIIFRTVEIYSFQFMQPIQFISRDDTFYLTINHCFCWFLYYANKRGISFVFQSSFNPGKQVNRHEIRDWKHATSLCMISLGS